MEREVSWVDAVGTKIVEGRKICEHSRMRSRFIEISVTRWERGELIRRVFEYFENRPGPIQPLSFTCLYIYNN